MLLLLRRTPRSRPLWAASAAVAATGLALLPLAIHQQRLDLASFIKETALVPRLLRSGKQFLVGFDAPLEIAATAAAGAVVAVGIVVALRRSGRGVYTAAALAAFGLLVPVVLALWASTTWTAATCSSPGCPCSPWPLPGSRRTVRGWRGSRSFAQSGSARWSPST